MSTPSVQPSVMDDPRLKKTAVVKTSSHLGLKIAVAAGGAIVAALVVVLIVMSYFGGSDAAAAATNEVVKRTEEPQAAEVVKDEQSAANDAWCEARASSQDAAHRIYCDKTLPLYRENEALKKRIEALENADKTP